MVEGITGRTADRTLTVQSKALSCLAVRPAGRCHNIRPEAHDRQINHKASEEPVTPRDRPELPNEQAHPERKIATDFHVLTTSPPPDKETEV